MAIVALITAPWRNLSLQHPCSIRSARCQYPYVTYPSSKPPALMNRFLSQVPSLLLMGVTLYGLTEGSMGIGPKKRVIIGLIGVINSGCRHSYQAIGRTL